MEERYIEQALKDSVEKLIKANITNEIEEEVERFRRKLESRKDQYIAEVMKGIRMYHERDMLSNGMNYKIIFENVVRLEK